MSKKTALILGSTGAVGSELVKILIEQNQYKKIHLLGRRDITITSPTCELHIVDFNELEKYGELFNVNDVFVCLGTTIKQAKSKEAFRKVDFDYVVKAAHLAKQAKTEKFLVITAMGANSKSSVFYSRVKGEVEDTLVNLQLPSLHIFRPSLLIGNREEFRLGEKIAGKFSKVMKKIMIGPLKSIRGIETKTVAAAMAKTASSTKKGTHIYPSSLIEEIANGK